MVQMVCMVDAINLLFQTYKSYDLKFKFTNACALYEGLCFERESVRECVSLSVFVDKRH